MSQIKKKHFIIIAGESSGDYHGAHLIENIQRENPEISFSGLGGPEMKKFGFHSLVPISRLAVMGFWEVLKKLLFFFQLEQLVLRHIQELRPDKIILIDYPGFNLRIVQKIKKLTNIKVLYYVSPQLWAWKENRIEIIKKHVDALIVLFPFEVEWYKKRGLHVEYFGHPLVEENLPKRMRKPKKKETYTIALCPGSRQQEITQHLPILMKLVEETKKKKMLLNFELFCAPNIKPSFLQALIKGSRVTINTSPILSSFKHVDFAVVASGTASLECAITLTPMVVIYKMSPVSWWTTSLLVKTPFASIVNILAGQKVVMELLQKHLTASRLLTIINGFLNNREQLAENQKKIFKIIQPLALKDVYKNTGSYIIKY